MTIPGQVAFFFAVYAGVPGWVSNYTFCGVVVFTTGPTSVVGLIAFDGDVHCTQLLAL